MLTLDQISALHGDVLNDPSLSNHGMTQMSPRTRFHRSSYLLELEVVVGGRHGDVRTVPFVDDQRWYSVFEDSITDIHLNSFKSLHNPVTLFGHLFWTWSAHSPALWHPRRRNDFMALGSFHWLMTPQILLDFKSLILSWFCKSYRIVLGSF